MRLETNADMCGGLFNESVFDCENFLLRGSQEIVTTRELKTRKQTVKHWRTFVFTFYPLHNMTATDLQIFGPMDVFALPYHTSVVTMSPSSSSESKNLSLTYLTGMPLAHRLGCAVFTGARTYAIKIFSLD